MSYKEQQHNTAGLVTRSGRMKRGYTVSEKEYHINKTVGKSLDPKPNSIVRRFRKIGRNEPCPCQSGLKFKKCCGGNNE